MTTPIYVKMDAKEQLLISEGVCRQLGIVQYHREVKPGNSDSKDSSVPSVRVKLVQTVKLRPEESVFADVRLVGEGLGGEQSVSEVMLVESDELQCEARVTASIIKPSADGVARVLLGC